MTSQLNYLVAQQRQAELVCRAEKARFPGEVRLAQSGSAARSDLTPSEWAIPSVACPPLCAHGMNSSTDKGYHLALGRLRRD